MEEKNRANPLAGADGLEINTKLVDVYVIVYTPEPRSKYIARSLKRAIRDNPQVTLRNNPILFVLNDCHHERPPHPQVSRCPLPSALGLGLRGVGLGCGVLCCAVVVLCCVVVLPSSLSSPLLLCGAHRQPKEVKKWEEVALRAAKGPSGSASSEDSQKLSEWKQTYGLKNVRLMTRIFSGDESLDTRTELEASAGSGDGGDAREWKHDVRADTGQGLAQLFDHLASCPLPAPPKRYAMGSGVSAGNCNCALIVCVCSLSSLPRSLLLTCRKPLRKLKSVTIVVLTVRTSAVGASGPFLLALPASSHTCHALSDPFAGSLLTHVTKPI